MEYRSLPKSFRTQTAYLLLPSRNRLILLEASASSDSTRIGLSPVTSSTIAAYARAVLVACQDEASSVRNSMRALMVESVVHRCDDVRHPFALRVQRSAPGELFN